MRNSGMIDLLRRIYPLALAPVSSGLDQCVEILKRELPFQIHEYPSSLEHNGWVVPKQWEVVTAEIKKGGRLIYDGKSHPLGVFGYSRSFHGRMNLAELKRHLSYRKDWPDAIGYHCDLYYKVGKEDWGFSIPYSLYDQLEEGEYVIELETAFQDGALKVCDYFLQGQSDDTIVINAHNCHAGQANDDIAGVVVGVELMKRLSLKENRYSYRLIIAPEHFGTVFYLAGLPKETIETFKFCAFLEMLGSTGPLAFQESFTGKSLLDKATHHLLGHSYPDHYSDRFRKIVGNDETVWEAPGYEIPCISLSRWPYPEYHTSLDNEDIISEHHLQESVEAVMGILNILETDGTLERRFTGLIALSHPEYDLYIDAHDPAIPRTVSDHQEEWNYLMDCLPRYFDCQTSILDIAVKHDLPYDELYDYVCKFKDKGLVEFHHHCW